MSQQRQMDQDVNTVTPEIAEPIPAMFANVMMVPRC